MIIRLVLTHVTLTGRDCQEASGAHWSAEGRRMLGEGVEQRISNEISLSTDDET